MNNISWVFEHDNGLWICESNIVTFISKSYKIAVSWTSYLCFLVTPIRPVCSFSSWDVDNPARLCQIYSFHNILFSPGELCVINSAFCFSRIIGRGDSVIIFVSSLLPSILRKGWWQVFFCDRKWRGLIDLLSFLECASLLDFLVYNAPMTNIISGSYYLALYVLLVRR